ncbi:hypothetical protein GYMLUDRAFT_242004 [Collybiopsis luxurians FD-317 M1]|uniref:Uncharacterized protein n=1 Tax=Collybiopsis luxurians FD-317 M1 TaxID=944289 RepID=A0A0D0BGA0_9AGAR|nr:hypothetical protein GYMLUDRAFT_242004 [Collybiopsis luxurians FD-317 M1]
MPKIPSTTTRGRPQTPSPQKLSLHNTPQRAATPEMPTSPSRLDGTARTQYVAATRASPRLAAHHLTQDRSSLQKATAHTLHPCPKPLQSTITVSPPRPKFDSSRLDSVEKLWLRHHYLVYLDIRNNATEKLSFLRRVADEFLRAFPSHNPVVGGSRLEKIKDYEAAK